MSKIYYVYVDWTTEEVPRAFYVGKGNEKRIVDFSDRNNHWRSIRDKYGCNRTILLGTKEESFAFEIEKQKIAFYKTYKAAWKDGSGWGANFTLGGDGVSGRTREVMSNEERARRKDCVKGRKHTEETKQKMRENNMGKNNPNFGNPSGWKHTEETLSKRKKLSGKNNPNYGKYGKLSATFGLHCSEERKAKISAANSGKTRSETFKENQRQRRLGAKASEETKRKMSIAFANGNSPAAKLTNEKVIEIKHHIKTTNMNNREIGDMFGVTASNIQYIRSGKTWKHIT